MALCIISLCQKLVIDFNIEKPLVWRLWNEKMRDNCLGNYNLLFVSRFKVSKFKEITLSLCRGLDNFLSIV